MQLSNVLRLSLLSSLVLLSLTGTPAMAENGPDSSLQSAAYTAGVQAYRSGAYDEAVNYFRRVLTQDAANTNAHYYLGLSLDQLHMTAEALTEYQFVAKNGRETKIVDYAKSRLQVLKGALQETSPNVAMIAAGNTVAPTVYRGMARQIAVPLKSNRNALMVDAQIENAQTQTTGTFIIDTGATYTSISQEMAEALGLDLVNCEKVRITTANGRIEVPKVVLQTLNVNGLEAHNVEATVIQVRPGSSFHGLLGLSFIRQFVLTIDPQAGQLMFQKN